MKTEDPELNALLRAARPNPDLPPRFQQNVWRRIEDGGLSADSLSWLDILATWILKPRLALAGVAVVMLAGLILGAHQGSQSIHNDAEARYLAAVAPNSLH